MVLDCTDKNRELFFRAEACPREDVHPLAFVLLFLCCYCLLRPCFSPRFFDWNDLWKPWNQGDFPEKRAQKKHRMKTMFSKFRNSPIGGQSWSGAMPIFRSYIFRKKLDYGYRCHAHLFHKTVWLVCPLDGVVIVWMTCVHNLTSFLHKKIRTNSNGCTENQMPFYKKMQPFRALALQGGETALCYTLVSM